MTTPHKKPESHTAEFPNFHLIDHPLVADKLSRMRMATTQMTEFRQLMKEAGQLLGYEATRGLAVAHQSIETPLAPMSAPFSRGPALAVVPILRAGMGLADGVLALMPEAAVGHIGLYRDDKTHRPVEYLVKLPDAADRDFLLVDPMLATGNSAVHAVKMLIDRGVEEQNIRFLALVAVPEGVKVMQKAHPSVAIYTAALDEKLNDHAYILPGLGDAGDRMFGTR
mgnify:CR=1 FL=1